MAHFPDPLFRNGLENYRKTAPASVWERVEAGLDKKKHKSPWLRIAAGLVLLLATMVMLFQRNQTDNPIATTSKKPATVTLDPDSAITDAAGRQEIGDRKQETGGRRQEIGSAEQTVTKKQITNSHQPTNVLESVRREEIVSPAVEVSIAYLNETDEITTSPTQLPTVEERMDVASIDASPDTRGTTISYSTEQVNERFIKKDVVAEATPEKKNASGLQKVIDKALDLKNDESVLADLREKKNELLSINYPSRKRATNR